MFWKKDKEPVKKLVKKNRIKYKHQVRIYLTNDPGYMLLNYDSKKIAIKACGDIFKEFKNKKRVLQFPNGFIVKNNITNVVYFGKVEV